MKWLLVIVIYNAGDPTVISTGRMFANKSECSQAHADLESVPRDDRADLMMFSKGVGYACFRVDTD